MRQWSIAAAVGLFLCIMVFAGAPVGAAELDPAFNQTLVGPDHAAGAVVWNHGRSINTEDSDSPTPPYLRVLRDAGRDVLRFNRPRDGDTLTASTRRLVELVGQLKHKGYRRIVLAGQSFGAFLALMATDSSDDVDAVVATAPAAFGNFDEFYDSWHLNATRLYPLLERIRPTLPRGSSIVVRGQVDSMNSSFGGLAFGIIFAILLVYALMVVNFQSWSDPFIILMALPGALSGIVWMLFVSHCGW